MDHPQRLELDPLLDGQAVQRSTVLLLVLTTIAMLADGFDLAAIGYIGPELVKQWGVKPAELVPVFSAGIVGLLVGAPTLGFLGDRIGRKRAIVLGLMIVGVFTLATVFATTLREVSVLRFITGIGLGGIIPNLIALTAEAAPKRLRGMFIVIVNFGVPAGISLPGLVSATLVPQYGWPALLVVGGVLPLLIGLLIAFMLPESLKFLAQRGGRGAEVLRRVSALRPDIAFGPQDVVTASAGPVRSGSPRGLFMGGLAAISPLMWVALAANQMANFFALSWLPTLLQAGGASTAHAGLNASLFSLGGIAGGLCLTVLVDRLGVLPMVLFFLAGVPLMALIGSSDLSPFWFAAVIAGAGFCVTGVNFNMNAALGMIYPTPVRSLGTGWAQAAGRLGSLAAPLVGGWLLGLHLPMQELLLAPAVSLGIGGVAAILLAILCVRRFGGTRLGESGRAGGVRAEVAG